MGEMKPTPGPWTTYLNTMDNVIVRKMSASGYEECVIARNVNHRNARLIAEAGTVFHNTGLSPVQLVEMVKELKAALNLWLGTANEPNAGWRGAGGSDVLFACEHCGNKHEDCTRLEHACDCPITLARAALAKCEGVGNG